MRIIRTALVVGALATVSVLAPSSASAAPKSGYTWGGSVQTGYTWGGGAQLGYTWGGK